MDSETSVNNYDANEVVDSCDYDVNSIEDRRSHDPTRQDPTSQDPETYFKNISLRYFAADPLQMLTDHEQLKKLCLENGNTEAHYIEGILQFFVHKKKQLGMDHLRVSAIGNNPDGMYLYGLLMLTEGHYNSGIKWLDKLKWKENRSRSDDCWERVKNSLSKIPVPMKRRYYINWVNFKPESKCNPENMNKLCKKCYHYKRLTQFVLFTGYEFP